MEVIEYDTSEWCPDLLIYLACTHKMFCIFCFALHKKIMDYAFKLKYNGQNVNTSTNYASLLELTNGMHDSYS